MGLGSRNARQHDTAISRHAVRSELFADFTAKQRVKTIDGIMGTVTAIHDGPYPGSEAYEVKLDHGMGGGLYTTSQLSAVSEVKTSEHHTAEGDYPELGSILYDRPDIARVE
jgi:hypothetical protein